MSRHTDRQIGVYSMLTVRTLRKHAKSKNLIRTANGTPHHFDVRPRGMHDPASVIKDIAAIERFDHQ